ncbi:MAG: hypothetical protein AAB648_01025 [Patescibacteria group bacterium]
MGLVRPTYHEWLQEMQHLVSKANMLVNSDAMSAIFVTIDTLMQRSLEIPPDHYSDYNKVVEESVSTVKMLIAIEDAKKLGVLAYINILRKSHDHLTQLIAKNITSSLLEYFLFPKN